MPCEYSAGGTRLVLLPQRAAWLPEHGTMLVADVHIGKAVAFRRLGVPVPRGTTGETLARLQQLVDHTRAEHVIVLGDLLHSRKGLAAQTLSQVERWRGEHPGLRITLVRGNHDDRAGDPPQAWGIECVDGPLRLAGLALLHEPAAVPGAYAIGGHVHPCAWVGSRHDRLRLPCFHFGPEVAVLPAFGAFTGMHAVKQAEGDRVFVIAGDEVRSLHSTHA